MIQLISEFSIIFGSMKIWHTIPLTFLPWIIFDFLKLFHAPHHLHIHHSQAITLQGIDQRPMFTNSGRGSHFLKLLLWISATCLPTAEDSPMFWSCFYEFRLQESSYVPKQNGFHMNLLPCGSQYNLDIILYPSRCKSKNILYRSAVILAWPP